TRHKKLGSSGLCITSLSLRLLDFIMPSTATVAMAGVGAFAAAGALSGAFVAPAGQVQHSEPQMQRTNLRAAGYGSSQTAGVGAMAGLGAVALSHTRDPAEIPFGEHGAEYVCESTGVFLTTEKVQPHLKAGAKKVIFSAPAKDDSHTIVMGVNESTYDPSMEAVSCASCTTNGLAPAVRVLQEWGYSCRVVDLIKHMAKEDAKAFLTNRVLCEFLYMQ
ncbi:GAPC1, partial [Symbiodinium sp. CCMP2456]